MNHDLSLHSVGTPPSPNTSSIKISIINNQANPVSTTATYYNFTQNLLYPMMKHHQEMDYHIVHSPLPLLAFIFDTT